MEELVEVIEMTLAEKLVTACVDKLRQDARFYDLWHAMGRDRDKIMFNMRHAVQYVLDRELLKRIDAQGETTHMVEGSGEDIANLINKLRPPG
jgi:hypothetical protein